MTDKSKQEVVSVIKEWASPMLIGVVGMLLWRDLSEMRGDVKLLLTQQSADRVRITTLETDVASLKQIFFQQLSRPQQNLPPNTVEYPTQRNP